MSLLDTMTDTDILSLQRKNEILRETLETYGLKMTDRNNRYKVAVDMIRNRPAYIQGEIAMSDDEYFVAVNALIKDKLKGKASTDHPGKPEATADENGQLDG